MNGLVAGIVMASMAAITGLSVAVALRLHFLDERHLRERDDARKQRDRLNTRNAELVEAVQKLQAMLAESERELTQCRIEQRALALKLAKALSKPRTVPIKRVDATKPTHPQKEQEG